MDNKEPSPKSGDMSEIHETALSQFDLAVSACEDERETSLADRRFVSISGAQWEGAISEQFQNRIMLETTPINLEVTRITNAFRNNRITAIFEGRTGAESDKLADVCAGLFRADEQDSDAEDAHDNAFDEGISGGFGAFRLTTEYEDEFDDENDFQRIIFEPVYDADCTVFFDPSAKKYDKSDAGFCFVLQSMSPDQYEKEFDDSPSTWGRPVENTEFDWSGNDLVYVAEYYVVEVVKTKSHKYQTIAGNVEKYTDAELTDEKIAELDSLRTARISTRTIKKRKVRKYILSGGGVLEDCGYIAGTEIPIIPFYGKRWFVDGKERTAGHIRYVKDAVRLKNMQTSLLAEQSAEGGDRIPIFTPEQTSGFETQWGNKAVDRPAFLNINPMTDQNGQEVAAGPIGYSEPASVPQSMAALLELSNNDFNQIMGGQKAGEDIQSNISGRAIELVQSRLDDQSYIYISNMAKSIKRAGKVWLEMARDIYTDESRRMKTVDTQGAASFQDMDEKVLVNGVPVNEIDLKDARFDVAVEVGPSSATKKQAVVNNMVNILPNISDPADRSVLSAFIMMNMTGEGVGDVREHFRKKLVQMGVVDATEKDIEAQAAAQEAMQPDPAQAAQIDFLTAETAKSAAQAKKAEADTIKTMADAELKTAQTAETMSGISRDDKQAAIDMASVIAQATGTGTTAPEVSEITGPDAFKSETVTNGT